MARQPGTSAAPSDDGQAGTLAAPREPSSGPARLRRAAAACTRCRRYRQKCVIQPAADGQPGSLPCQSCKAAGRGIARACTVLPRGFSAADREFRRRRRPSSELDDDDDGSADELDTYDAPAFDASPTTDMAPPDMAPPAATPPAAAPPARPDPPPSDAGSLGVDPLASSPHASLLLPHAEVVAGVHAFCFNYMQLGSFPRSFFFDQVERDPTSVSAFLLLAILAVAGRFTPAIVKRFGGRQQAADELSRRALSLIADEMVEASLERVQAFFILGTAQFGDGNGGRSWLLFGIAVRMAATLNLHREASFSLPPNATPEDLVRSEMARRAFWLVYLHDQQIAGRSPSTTFPLNTIDTLLPCDEDDFLFGQPVASRSALPGTLGAGLRRGHLAEPSRSIFATMITGQWLWARVAEQACKPTDPRKARPWLPEDDFMRLQNELDDWEGKLPPRHVFSAFMLRAMKSQSLDIAFLSIGVVLRLSNIVLRRTYLPRMAAAIDPGDPHDYAQPGPPGFWKNMMLTMVQNAVALSDQLEAYTATRSVLEGFPAVLILGVYMCGDIAYFLSRWPKLCSLHAPAAPRILQSSLRILAQLEEAWPLATRWRVTLQHLVANNSVTSLRAMANEQRAQDERESIFRDYQSRAEPMFTSPEAAPPPGASSHSLFLPPVEQAAAFLAEQPGRLTSHTPAWAVPLAQTMAPASLPDTPVDAAAQMPFLLDVPTDDGILANVSLDAFGADLTAFLRGEPVEWYGLDDTGGAE